MYNDRVLVHNVPDADQVYIQKLKASLAELNAIKEAAAKSENFSTVEVTRSKISALKLQLAKLEDGFNSDVITTHITAWQEDLSGYLSKTLNDNVVCAFVFLSVTLSLSFQLTTHTYNSQQTTAMYYDNPFNKTF